MVKLTPRPPLSPPAPEAPRVIGRREERRGAGAYVVNQMPKALAEELAHMVQACAIVDLTMGAGTWATAALEQGLPLLRGGLDGHTQPRSHGPPQGGGRNRKKIYTQFLPG